MLRPVSPAIWLLTAYILANSANICLASNNPPGRAAGEDTAVMIIDDYEDYFTDRNTLGLWTGGNRDRLYTLEEADDNRDIGSRVKRLRYDCSVSWNGFWYASNVWNGNTFMNASKYGCLSFRIRGEEGGEDFYIQLQYGQPVEGGPQPFAEILSSDYFRVSKEWQDAAIPLSVFPGVDGARVRSVCFIFKKGLTSEAGTIYLDDLAFSTREPNLPGNRMIAQEKAPAVNGGVLMVDNFNDADTDRNSLGRTARGSGHSSSGNPGDGCTVEQVRLYSYKDRDETNNALRLKYDCTQRGGTFRYISELWNGLSYIDASGFDLLAFRVRGEEGKEEFFIQLTCADGDNGGAGRTSEVSSSDYVKVDKEWQQVIIPLSDFQGLNRSGLKEVSVGFRKRRKIGHRTVDIDDICFVKGLLKPEGSGRISIKNSNRSLMVGGSPFIVKGVCYQPTPIGRMHSHPDDPWIYDRDFPILAEMGCNTIRTWGMPGPVLMKKAEEYGLMVIAGFWMNDHFNYGEPDVRKSVKARFAAFVEQYKESPALLMWAVGNENNYTNGSDKAYYSLADELARTAYEVEGDAYHPVMLVNGRLYDIGMDEKGAADMQLGYIDVWGSNIYAKHFSKVEWLEGEQNIFEVYKHKSSKPLMITEYGADAYYTVNKDPLNGQEDETAQADWVWRNTAEIMSASDVCLGGCVMEYSDEWWKDPDGTVSRQDAGPAADWGAHLPDGYANEEYWGIVRIAPDGRLNSGSKDGLDDIKPRKVYYVLKNLFRNRSYARR